MHTCLTLPDLYLLALLFFGLMAKGGLRDLVIVDNPAPPVDKPAIVAPIGGETRDAETPRRETVRRVSGDAETPEALARRRALRAARNRRHRDKLKRAAAYTPAETASSPANTGVSRDARGETRLTSLEEERLDLFPSEESARDPRHVRRERLMHLAMQEARRLLSEKDYARLVEQVTERGRYERYLARGTGGLPEPLRDFFEKLFPVVQAKPPAQPATAAAKQGWLHLPITMTNRGVSPPDASPYGRRETG